MPGGELGYADVERRAGCQQLVDDSPHRATRRRVAVGEVLQRGYVGGACEQFDDGRRSVPTGASDLLAVALQALGQVVVIDVAHVGLVDAHAESDRRHDDGAV